MAYTVEPVLCLVNGLFCFKIKKGYLNKGQEPVPFSKHPFTLKSNIQIYYCYLWFLGQKKTDTTSLTGVDLEKQGQSEPGGSCGLAEVFISCY